MCIGMHTHIAIQEVCMAMQTKFSGRRTGEDAFGVAGAEGVDVVDGRIHAVDQLNGERRLAILMPR